MYRIFAALLLLFVYTGYTQDMTNSIKYDYSTIHNNGSTSVNKHFAEINYVQGLKNDTLVYTAGISAYNVSYDMAAPVTTNNLQHITALKLGITYLHNLGNSWKGMATFTPQVVSNFKSTGIQDVYPGFFIGARKTIGGSKASVLTFGGGYNGYFGKYLFMPVANYYKKLNEKLSFNVGIPSTDVTYKITTQHVVKAIAFADAFYSKLRGENFMYSTPNVGLKLKAIEMLTLNGGLEYNYISAQNWIGTLRAGYSFYNKLTLNDSHNNDHDINFNNNMYLSVGFKYNLNF